MIKVEVEFYKSKSRLRCDGVLRRKSRWIKFKWSFEEAKVDEGRLNGVLRPKSRLKTFKWSLKKVKVDEGRFNGVLKKHK